jgi:hypothetical protein
MEQRLLTMTKSGETVSSQCCTSNSDAVKPISPAPLQAAEYARLRANCARHNDITTVLKGVIQQKNREIDGLRKDLDQIIEGFIRDLVCDICAEVPYQPLTLQCQHAYCGSCIAAWFATQPPQSRPYKCVHLSDV